MAASAAVPGQSIPLLTDDPGYNAAAITPSDTVNLSTPCRAIYVGVSGDITLIPYDGGNAVLFKSVPQGAVLPMATQRVNATGTTATNLVAMW